MQQQKPAEANRIARDLSAWKRVEDKLAERYGRKIVYDRDFLKAKRDIYKHIRNKHKNKRLNLFEQAEMRVLRGQHRNLLRQIYPNPFIRLIRNLLVFTGNVVAITLRAIVRIGNAFFLSKASPALSSGSTRLYASNKQREPHRSPDGSRQQLSANGTAMNNTKAAKQKLQSKAAVSQAKAVVRKLPVKSRIQMPATQGKGIRRS